MLALQLKSGDYLTIGDDIAVQVFQQNGAAFRVEVKAPREVPILRGSLHERDGGARPDGLLTRKPTQPSRRARNAKNLDAIARRKSALMEMQRVLDGMDADDASVRELRRQLDRITAN